MRNRITRLTTCEQISQHWPFIREGLEVLRTKARYDYDDDVVLKTLFSLVSMGDRAWIGMATSKNGKPLAFAASYDNTPIFAPERSFIAYVVYSNSKDEQVVSELQQEFEQFCRQQNIKTLITSTRRCNGAAVRCFRKYGLEPDYLFFRKKL